MSDWQPPKGQGILSGAIARTRGERAIIPQTPEGGRPEIVVFESWPGVTFTEAGLVFSDKLDKETWQNLGAFLGSLNQKSKLWISDWITESERREWDYSYDELVIITGLKRETLYNYASIGRRVPLQNRIAGPNTGLYEAVAVLPKHEQVAMLKRAIEGGWDRDRTRDAVQALRGGGVSEPDNPPFAEEMADIANLTPALGFEEKTGDVSVYILAVPDSLTWSTDYYGALREILPETIKVGETWEIVARRRE